MRAPLFVLALGLGAARASGDELPSLGAAPTCTTFDGRPGDVVKIVDNDGGVSPRCVGRQEGKFEAGHRSRTPSVAAFVVTMLAAAGGVALLVARTLLRK